MDHDGVKHKTCGNASAAGTSAAPEAEMSADECSWKILWYDHTSDTYLYGSEIRFLEPDDVSFKNQLMPPGTVIKTWYSRTNYQAQRIEPVLPLIDGEGHYHISMDADCDVPEGLLLRLSFLGKDGTQAGSFVLKGKESDFSCPLKTYSYEAQLICAGAHTFHFHSFTISEILYEKYKSF